MVVSRLYSSGCSVPSGVWADVEEEPMVGVRIDSDVVDSWLWFDDDDKDDWTQLILVRQSIGERQRLRSIRALGVGELAGDRSDGVSHDADDGVGLTSGLGYGVRLRWLALLVGPGLAPP